MAQMLWTELINDPKKSIKFYAKNSERAKLEKKYSDKLSVQTEFKSLISYSGGKKLPIFRLFRYKEAFSQDLVSRFIKELNLNKNDLVLDPFSGMGTTCFGCMLKGIPSIGIEMLPIAHFISTTIVKFFKIEPKKIKEIFKTLEKNIPNSKLAEIALDVPIIKKAFTENTLDELRKWKFQIDTLQNPYRDIFVFLFLSILEDCSHTSKDGQFLRIIPDKKIPKISTALLEKILEAENDILLIKSQKPTFSKTSLILGNSLNTSNYFTNQKKPNVVITSPPYLNRYDYTRSYALELCLHFVKNHAELKKIRFEILRSHIECKEEKNDTKSNHPAVTEIIKKLNSLDLNNRRIPIMVAAYFTDMKKVIQELSLSLDDKAKIILVVDNVRFEGEMIPVDLILSDIAAECGFKVNNIIIPRYKGNSSQQMKKYGLAPVRESIVVWER